MNKDTILMLLQQAGYKKEKSSWVNHTFNVSIHESIVDGCESEPVGDDSELWDEAFTNIPVRIHWKAEEWFKSKYKLSRK